MATFRVGQKTDRSVLPQRRALESAPVDNPGDRDETGRGRHFTVAPGVEHVRGETLGGSPATESVTPNRRVGEQGREAHLVHPVVFVLDKHGAPLDPCPPARARKLLATGRALVHRHTPFVIRLKDRTLEGSEVQGVEIGIDPGSRHTGIAVFTAADGVRAGKYAVQLDHRGLQIKAKLEARSNYRRGRRSRNLRYRAPRFSNRTKPAGWLAPSLRHRVDTTTTWVGRLSRWTPVTAVHVERVAFDVAAMTAGRPLDGVEYQHGTLAGTEIREYLLAKWRRACAYCGVTGVPLNIDHIHPRSKGGSDRVSNLTLACIPCNQKKNATPVEEFVTNPDVLRRILAQAKAPLRDAAAMNATRYALVRALKELHPDVRSSSGGRTKWNRTRTGAPKTHTLDALHVGELDGVGSWPAGVLVVKATGRGRYQRTSPDRFGFPRLTRSRIKVHCGFQTGDLVRAVVPSGKKAGTHVGRVAVRARGSFNITTRHGFVPDIHHRHVRLLQRADGYGYTRKGEGASSPA